MPSPPTVSTIQDCTTDESPLRLIPLNRQPETENRNIRHTHIVARSRRDAVTKSASTVCPGLVGHTTADMAIVNGEVGVHTGRDTLSGIGRIGRGNREAA